ncbi:C40 family peptidase [Yersinia pseudotuberculosis]|uniref:C40 family peptidase n=1 Tax=Yersinia pseudotuberculosis TaxID=633 RepID=UPI0005E48954|nr:C40 family peptidase [Yersinia pseudotuberculosis]CNC46835.1 NlpC/P60 family lipoprotein [Yersinia pseudotuberculosis]
MRLMLTLFVLLFTQLFLNLAHASPQAHSSVEQKKGHASQASPDDRKKRKADKSTKRSKITTTKGAVSKKATEPRKTGNNKTSTNKVVRNKTTSNKIPRNKINSNRTTESKTATNKKGTSIRRTAKTPYGRHRNKAQGKASTELAVNNKLKLSPAHKKRYQKAKQTAMSKLMKQVGKPYRWGGSSPNTGFDCSGLIYYAYKDVVKIKMPRTANEMYHLRDAAPVKRTELESGDLVFFKIANRGVADHVGVYLGNGKFIQSPRTGEEIRISMLNNDYWQDHYVGARRVVTPKTIR